MTRSVTRGIALWHYVSPQAHTSEGHGPERAVSSSTTASDSQAGAVEGHGPYLAASGPTSASDSQACATEGRGANLAASSSTAASDSQMRREGGRSPSSASSAATETPRPRAGMLSSSTPRGDEGLASMEARTLFDGADDATSPPLPSGAVSIPDAVPTCVGAVPIRTVWHPPGAPRGALRALVLFAGPCTADTHLTGALADAGFEVEPVDTLIGGDAHDLARGEVAAEYIRRIRVGYYAVVAMGTPCSTYSVLRDTPLRSKDDPTGESVAPRECLETLRVHNRLAEVTAAAIVAAHDSGAAWMLENPADVGVAGQVCYWPEKAHYASLFDQPCIKAVLRATKAVGRIFAMCAFGAPWRKYTTMYFGGSLREPSASLDSRGCSHGTRGHAVRLDERDAEGESRATQASAYPAELCYELARLCALAASGGLLPRGEWPPGPPPNSTPSGTPAEADTARPGGHAAASVEVEGATIKGTYVEGGRIAHGRQLHPSLAEHVDARRRSVADFASLRNLEAEPVANLRLERFPAGLRIEPGPEKKPRKRKLSRALPRTTPPANMEGGVSAPSPAPAPPEGPIAIEQLFLPGVYTDRIESWFDLVDGAINAPRARKLGSRASAPSVETRVIEQHEMAPFARGIVWDCADRNNCVPVARSTADTKFPGDKQLNRAGLWLMAEVLGETEDEVIRAACGGGVEMQSDCELITVLAFHHPGLFDELEAAQKAVQKEFDEQWSDRPIRHLPFVPCRLCPKDVVLQDRVRIVEGHFEADGRPSVEAYTKARVTSNSSHGGVDSVNAAIPEEHRAVRLPRAQWQARALAVADEACLTPFSRDRHRVEGADGASRELRAVPYLADAESAYSYCNVQEADQWQQCFVWWGPAGVASKGVGLPESSQPIAQPEQPILRSGISRARRVGFGGASSPRSFQKIATVATGYARSLQYDFDRRHPYPPPVLEWRRERESAQMRDELACDPEELDPAYAQVYIDDAAGVALNDAVPTPGLVEHIHIDDAPTRALGGSFPPADSRVLVHAKLLVLAMQMAGLHAAPDKILVGDPIISLGFSMSGVSRKMTVPYLKRAAMLASASELIAEARESSRANRRSAQRLLGRLVNVSQILPELKTFLRGGFRATDSSWARRAGLRPPVAQRLAVGSAAHTEWITLLDVANHVITLNEGIPIAPRRVFRAPQEGAVLCTSDASGDDGFGGYVFMPDGDPSMVYIVSEFWPSWALEARRQNDKPIAERAGSTELEFSMPAAELFASWAVAEAAVTKARLMTPQGPARAQLPSQRPVIAIGDCEPSVFALDAATSGEPAMRAILAGARRLTPFWLGVHVPREANRDADLLSHPENIVAVMAAAFAGGFRPLHARVPKHCWDALRPALEVGAAARRATKGAHN